MTLRDLLAALESLPASAMSLPVEVAAGGGLHAIHGASVQGGVGSRVVVLDAERKRPPPPRPGASR